MAVSSDSPIAASAPPKGRAGLGPRHAPAPQVLATDGELLAQFKRHGDQAALDRLVDRHSAMVWRVCRATLRRSQDVEDAFQATFLLLIKHGRSIKSSDSAAGWLYRVAHRTSLRARKKLSSRREEALAVDPLAPSETAFPDLLQKQTTGVLVEELMRLPAKYQAPLVLRYLEGQSRRAIAEQTDTTVAAVQGRLARGKQLLRRRLLRRGVSLAAAMGALGLGARGAAAAENAPARVLAQTTSNSAALAGGGSLAASAGVLSLYQEGVRAMLALTIGKPLASMAGLVAAALLLMPPGEAGEGAAPAPASDLRLDVDLAASPSMNLNLAEQGAIEFVQATPDPTKVDARLQADQVELQVRDGRLAQLHADGAMAVTSPGRSEANAVVPSEPVPPTSDRERLARLLTLRERLLEVERKYSNIVGLPKGSPAVVELKRLRAATSVEIEKHIKGQIPEELSAFKKELAVLAPAASRRRESSEEPPAVTPPIGALGSAETQPTESESLSIDYTARLLKQAHHSLNTARSLLSKAYDYHRMRSERFVNPVRDSAGRATSWAELEAKAQPEPITVALLKSAAREFEKADRLAHRGERQLAEHLSNTERPTDQLVKLTKLAEQVAAMPLQREPADLNKMKQGIEQQWWRRVRQAANYELSRSDFAFTDEERGILTTISGDSNELKQRQGAALRRYQEAKGHEPTGELNEATWNAVFGMASRRRESSEKPPAVTPPTGVGGSPRANRLRPNQPISGGTLGRMKVKVGEPAELSIHTPDKDQRLRLRYEPAADGRTATIDLLESIGDGKLEAAESPKWPVVVETVPRQGATEVDPGLTEVRFTFDRDMNTSSYSFSGQALNKESKPEWINPRTCLVPVRLQSDREYRLVINAPGRENTRSAEGAPARIDELRFRTRAIRQGLGAERSKKNEALAANQYGPDSKMKQGQWNCLHRPSALNPKGWATIAELNPGEHAPVMLPDDERPRPHLRYDAWNQSNGQYTHHFTVADPPGGDHGKLIESSIEAGGATSVRGQEIEVIGLNEPTKNGPTLVLIRGRFDENPLPTVEEAKRLLRPNHASRPPTGRSARVTYRYPVGSTQSGGVSQSHYEPTELNPHGWVALAHGAPGVAVSVVLPGGATPNPKLRLLPSSTDEWAQLRIEHEGDPRHLEEIAVKRDEPRLETIAGQRVQVWYRSVPAESPTTSPRMLLIVRGFPKADQDNAGIERLPAPSAEAAMARLYKQRKQRVAADVPGRIDSLDGMSPDEARAVNQYGPDSKMKQGQWRVHHKPSNLNPNGWATIAELKVGEHAPILLPDDQRPRPHLKLLEVDDEIEMETVGYQESELKIKVRNGSSASLPIPGDSNIQVVHLGAGDRAGSILALIRHVSADDSGTLNLLHEKPTLEDAKRALNKQSARRVATRAPGRVDYTDGKADGKKSLGGSGHLIKFELPEGAVGVKSVRIHGSRYGTKTAPREDFEISFLNEDRSEILDIRRGAYGLFRRGAEKWTNVRFKDPVVDLPKTFWVAIDFNPGRTKGVYLSYDKSTSGERSMTGLAQQEPGEHKPVDFGGDWMVSVVLERADTASLTPESEATQPVALTIK